MYKPLLLLITILCILSGCSRPRTKPAESVSALVHFRINDHGDTVIINRHPDDGRILSEATMKYGKLHGLTVNYYENGNIQNEIQYSEGKKNGRVTLNYESGKIFKESFYVDDQLEGIQKRYYENGQLMAEVPYKEGLLQTGSREYTKEGKVKQLIPELIIQPIDKIAFEDRYILKLSLSKKQKNVRFYCVKDYMGQKIPVLLDARDGMAETDWIVPKGSYVMEKVLLIAEFRTLLDTPFRLEKTYNVAVEHR